jgi:hypothetical protein
LQHLTFNIMRFHLRFGGGGEKHEEQLNLYNSREQKKTKYSELCCSPTAVVNRQTGDAIKCGFVPPPEITNKHMKPQVA